MKCPKCQAANPDTQPSCGDCGTALSPANHEPPKLQETLRVPLHELAAGSTFAGRYQVIEELGRGGMGSVYKVLDADAGRPEVEDAGKRLGALI